MSRFELPFPVIVKPGFFLLCAGLLYLDDGYGLLIWAILGGVIHEAGHILAERLMGGRVERLTLSFAGAELQMESTRLHTYFQENIVALGGPALNFISAIPLLHFKQYLVGAIFLGLGVCNLLPVLPLDGGRILKNILSLHFGPARGERAATVIGAVTAGCLVGFGVISLVRYANGLLLVGALWLLVGLLKKRPIFCKK